MQPAPSNFAVIPRTALFGALLLLLIGVLAAYYEEHLYQSQRDTAMREHADVLAASVTAALSFDDRPAAAEYVEPMKVNPAIEAVGVYNTSGALLAGFDRVSASHLPPARFGTGTMPSFGSRALAIPVSEHNTRLGTIYIRASAEPLENRLSRYTVLALLAIMAAIVVAGVGNAQARLQRQALRLSTANLRLQEEIAQRAKAEDALRQSQKMEAMGQLSGGIAHDFNNHLMIIKGNLHFLQRKLSLPDSDRHVAGALEGVSRAAALTQRILSFSRRQALTPAPLDLGDLVLGMNELIRSSLRENVDIKEDLLATSLVVVDRNQMENVILNLVINARDAMPRGGALFIGTKDCSVGEDSGSDIPPGDYVELIVRDSGIGMSAEVRAKALDPFFTTKPVGQGTGLGLSTTYGFITQSGGQMKIDSELQRGTAIRIFLPRYRQADSNALAGKN